MSTPHLFHARRLLPAASALLLPLATLAQGWADGGEPVEAELPLSTRMAVRAMSLTRAPASATGPSVMSARLAGERGALLADYRLRGAVRLTGGLTYGNGSAGGLRPGTAWSGGGDATDGAWVASYLGLGWRQRSDGDRGWDLRGDLGVSLGRSSIVRSGSAGLGTTEPVRLPPTAASLAESRNTGLRLAPQLSLGAQYRY